MRPNNRHKKNSTQAHEQLSKLMTPFLKKFSKRYPAGSYVFKEDETARYIFFVINGILKLTKKCVAQREQQLSVVEHGKFAGMEAVFPYGYYYCSAIAVTESVICAVPKEEFLQVFYHYNASTFLIMNELYREINEAEEKIYSIETEQLFYPINDVHRNIL
jgi:CRP-like cAMP-binding protein